MCYARNPFFCKPKTVERSLWSFHLLKKIQEKVVKLIPFFHFNLFFPKQKMVTSPRIFKGFPHYLCEPVLVKDDASHNGLNLPSRRSTMPSLKLRVHKKLSLLLGVQPILRVFPCLWNPIAVLNANEDVENAVKSHNQKYI